MKKKLNQNDRLKIYNKYNERCAYCGEKIESVRDMQVDHIISKYNFISNIKNNKQPYFLKHLTEEDVNHFDNLNPSCRVCNKWKDAFTLEKFRNEIKSLIERLNKYSPQYRMAKKYGLIKEEDVDIVFYFENIYNKILDEKNI